MVSGQCLTERGFLPLFSFLPSFLPSFHPPALFGVYFLQDFAYFLEVLSCRIFSQLQHYCHLGLVILVYGSVLSIVRFLAALLSSVQ